MRAADRMVIAVAVAVVLTMFSLRHLTRDLDFVMQSFVLVAVLSVVTLVLRRLRVLPGPTFAAQVVVLCGAALLVARGLSPVRPDSYWANLAALVPEAARHMREQSAPMEPNSGVTFLLVVTVGAIWIMTDVMVAALQRVVWSLAPLATLYLVPALGLVGDIGIVDCVLLATGYLGILAVEGMNRTGRWSHGLTHDSARGIGSAEPVVVRSALLIGVPALVLALIAGQLMPTLSIAGWGSGGRGNQGPLQLTDPTADLRRNLNMPEDQVILRYTTDAPGGQYLRLASLPAFNQRGFANTQIAVDSGPLPDPPGMSGQHTTRTTRVQIGDVNMPSGYLLAPYAPQSFTADGRWVWDPNSLVIISAEREGRQLRNMSYEVTNIEVAPDGRALADAGSGPPPDAEHTLDVPDDLPQSIRDLTTEITRDADTPALKAAAIQAYLRSNQFTYSTEPQPGTGYDALERFLLQDRTGYCEQFAAAMAAMARVVDIPSRFAVGFLPGERVGDYWEVSVHDFHSWPELYFAGIGWVRYEPTPSVGTAPPWSLASAGESGDEPTDVPSNEASSSTSVAPQEPTAPQETSAPVVETPEVSAVGIITVAALLAAALLVLTILAAPALLRLRLRRRRFAPAQTPAAQVEAAWSELRDTKLDARSTWPTGSPRRIAREVARDLDGDDAAAMSRLGVLVERARYSRAFDDAADVAEVPELAQQVRTALLSPLPGSRRLAAVVAPRSLVVRFRAWFQTRLGRH